MQFSILREINFTHAAAADERDNFVSTNCLPGTKCAFAHERFRREMKSGNFDELACALLLLEKRFNFRAHRRIGSALIIEKRRARFRFAFDGRLNELGQPLGALIRHALRLA
jgi:hypothetical protein